MLGCAIGTVSFGAAKIVELNVCLLGKDVCLGSAHGSRLARSAVENRPTTIGYARGVLEH